MRLTELNPSWLKVVDDRTFLAEGVPRSEADGVIFKCPKCWLANGGPVGTHVVICWAPHVSQDHSPRPGRWELVGDTFETLSLRAGSSSVLIPSGCCAHFFVTDGDVRMC